MAAEIAAARAELEQNLDGSTLLPLFVARVPARVAAAIDMIADGTVRSCHFFREHSTLMETDPETGEQAAKPVSLLDDLIEENKRVPDLSFFSEGQHATIEGPDARLLADVNAFLSLLSACRSDKADIEISCSANNPELIIRSWSMIVQKMTAFRSNNSSDAIQAIYWDGVREIENLPPSKARAATAERFACSVRILNQKEQFDAFKRATKLIIEAPKTDLFCSVASSLSRLDRKTAPSCARYLMCNARRSTKDAWHRVPAAIGEAVGKTGREIEKWDDAGRLTVELRRLNRALKG